MSEIRKKVVKIGLKNAIIIRTNLDPFKINDPDMEQVRGVWRCGKRADQIDYFIGAVRLMPGDPIVNDHYGDVLWKNGNKIQARYYWNYVLKLKKIETKLKKEIKEKLIFGPKFKL